MQRHGAGGAGDGMLGVLDHLNAGRQRDLGPWPQRRDAERLVLGADVACFVCVVTCGVLISSRKA